MGNTCFCSNSHYFKDIKINICLDKQSMNEITEQVINKENIINEKQEKEINELKKYFDENEKEIINSLNQKQKAKKRISKKIRETMIGNMFDTKYELMMKRLLEQKNIKRKGPKRRETIRNEGDNIKKLINEVINKNKNNIKNNKKVENKLLKRDTSLIIKNTNKTKVRLSVTIDKKDRMINNLNNGLKKNLQNQQLKNVNTLNEIINEGNTSSLLCKKETSKK